MKLRGPLAVPPPVTPSWLERSELKLVPVPEPYLNSKRLGAGQVHDAFHRVIDGVNEAGRALRILVARSRMHHAACHWIPMPVLSRRKRLQPIAAHVEPHRRVEGHFLRQQHVRQFIVERRPRHLALAK